MLPALSGAITGFIVAVLLFVFDYMMLRQRATERAKKNHQTKIEFDQTDKGRIISLVRFLVMLPILFGIGNWMLSKA
jgi:cytochrome oxidase assembly protein ShyY1